jgi:two-component system sensor histidine kinase PilS (NtrC family)
MMVQSRRFLRLLYLARLTLAAGIFAGALLVWTRPVIGPETTLLATLVLVVSLLVTGASFWHTHIAERVPSANFLYLQAIFDTLLVTTVVHLTGGTESDFASLYILVIAEGALMLPLRGGMLIGALAVMLYFADGVWGHSTPPSPGVFLQLALFAVTALVTAWLGERLRRTGTQLGAMELALRQLRLDTDDILGTIDTGVVTVDEDGNLAYMNHAAETLLGVREREWLGRPVLKELDRRAPGLGGTMRRTSTGRVPVHWYETRLHDSSSSGRVLGVRTTALEREERPWVTAVVQDISDGKRLEDLHRRADRLQAVAELAASLAHELKNPLASIRSATEQLTDGHVATEDRKTLKTLVLAESDRLSRLLSEFIEFSRVEVNRRERVDLPTVVSGACRLASQHPDGVSGAPVRLRRADGALAVDGDEDLLHRAVFNLVLNALQVTPADGEVIVEIGAIDDVELPPGVTVANPIRLSVRDTGPGIPEEDMERIFDPFYTRRAGGTGLGLALVHRAVEAHLGAVLVDTQPGAGAMFTIYLPAYQEQNGS